MQRCSWNREKKTGREKLAAWEYPSVDDCVIFVRMERGDLWVPEWENVYDTFADLRKRFPRVAKQ